MLLFANANVNIAHSVVNVFKVALFDDIICHSFLKRWEATFPTLLALIYSVDGLRV